MAERPSRVALVSASRKVQIVLASGTGSARPRPRKRMKESRSFIRNSVRSSERLWLACRIRDLEHEHVIERWASAARAVRPRHGSLQVRPEELEVHQPVQPLQRIALGREILQTLIDVEEPGLPPHPTPPSLTTIMES